MERSKEIKMSNVEKEDECEYCNAHLKWEDEASELDEDKAREVDEEIGEVEDREINSGGRNSNEVSDKIIETCGIDNGDEKNSSEVREIGMIDNEGVMVEMFKDM
jgi:hypothetical protein